MDIRYNRERHAYYIKEKIDGQFYLMVFYYNKDPRYRSVEISVFLQIYRKRKHREKEYGSRQITGKNPLITYNFCCYAYEMLEEYIRDLYSHRKVSIFVFWTSKRRKEAYRRFLEKRGFRFGHNYGEESLVKIIKPNDSRQRAVF